MKSKLFLAPWGSHCGNRSLDSPEGKAELHPQHAVLEPGIPGAGMGHWELPVLLASPYHDFEQGLGGLLFWGPYDSGRAGLHGPRTSSRGVLFPQVTPGLQVTSQGWPRSRGVLGLCLPQTSHPVRSQLGCQSWRNDRLHLDELGRSPDCHPGPLSPLTATLHGGKLRSIRAHFWVLGRSRRSSRGRNVKER